MKNLVKRFLKRKNPEYVDVSHEIILYADMIEDGRLTINQFINRWNDRMYKSNLFASSAELSLMAGGIGDLIELHDACVDHSPELFADKMRNIVFQYGTGVNN